MATGRTIEQFFAFGVTGDRLRVSELAPRVKWEKCKWRVRWAAGYTYTHTHTHKSVAFRVFRSVVRASRAVPYLFTL